MTSTAAHTRHLAAPALPAAPGQALAVARRTLVERWRGLLAWGTGLVLMAVVQLSVYPSVRQSGEGMQAFVDQWPPALREAFGLSDYTSGAGYLNTELFSLMVPLVLVGVGLAAGAAATAGEEERGTLDLLLSTPVSRVTVLVGKALALVAGVAAVAAALWLTVTLGAPAVDLEIGAAAVARATLMAALLGLLFGSVGLLVGALTGSRGAALGVGIALALAAYLLNALAPLADWLEPWQKASPFDWAFGGKPLSAGFDGAGAALLLGATVVVAVAAALVFRRRDISSR